MDSLALSVHDLTVYREQRCVLSGISFDVSPSAFVSIVGRSGAGKSTLLHALARHIPFQGSIRAPKDIGIVFQKNAVFPWMTVRQNIAIGMPEDGTVSMDSILSLAGLCEYADQYPHHLSGGQVQRIAVAREYRRRPSLLLLDEPFASLDAITRSEMIDWLSTLRRAYAMTVILVTHSIDEASRLSDHLLELVDGKLFPFSGTLQTAIPLTP